MGKTREEIIESLQELVAWYDAGRHDYYGCTEIRMDKDDREACVCAIKELQESDNKYAGHCVNRKDATMDEEAWDEFDDVPDEDVGELMLVQGEDGVFHEYDPKLDATFHFETKEAMEYFLAQVEKVSGKCKTCKFFEYDSVAKVDGIPLIVAHEICTKWGEGCKTSEDGYCFMYEPKEVEE